MLGRKSDPQDSPQVAVHPPVLALAAVLIGLVLDALHPLPFAAAALGLGFVGRMVAGGAVVGLGLLLAGASVRRFRSARTGIATWQASTALVAEGPYRWSRNPIYIALLLVLAGIALLLDSLWLLVLLAPVWAVLRYGVIAREERYLERRFGASYLSYKGRVRRWL